MSTDIPGTGVPRPAFRHGTGQRVLEEALRGVGAGDRVAFDQVYRLTSAKLFGICVRLMPTRWEAEDVLQDAYCSIWRRAGSFDETRGAAMTWLIAVTRNAAIDRLRVTRATMLPVDLASAIPDTTPLASAKMEADEERQRMLTCLYRLPSGDAGLLRAAYFDGLTYAEVAERTSAPLGTIKSRIRRTLLVLRADLE